MAQQTQVLPNTATILANLPPGTTRVQVVDHLTGKTKYKKPAAISLNDQIMLTAKGEPVVMTGTPGRKARTVLQPVTPQVGETLEAKKQALHEDDLLQTVKSKPEAGRVLDIVMEGMAEEAASLSFERQEAERRGEPTSAISVRRLRALKATADTWLKRKEQLTQQGVDLDSKAFEVVFGFILETLRECMLKSGLRDEQCDTVFTQLSAKLNDGWAEEAKLRLEEG